MRWISATLVIASLFVFAVPAHAAPKVAVVDLVRCMEAHPETTKLEERRQAALKQAQDNLQLQDKRLKELERKLKMLSADDPDLMTKRRQFELQANSAKFNFEWHWRRIGRPIQPRVVKIRIPGAIDCRVDP